MYSIVKQEGDFWGGAHRLSLKTPKNVYFLKIPIITLSPSFCGHFRWLTEAAILEPNSLPAKGLGPALNAFKNKPQVDDTQTYHKDGCHN